MRPFGTARGHQQHVRPRRGGEGDASQREQEEGVGVNHIGVSSKGWVKDPKPTLPIRLR